MTALEEVSLPSYLEQSPEVAARLREIKSRPVLLELDRVYKHFHGAAGPVTALSDISFQVYRNEFVSVIGPSGCGKSTLIRILAGLTQPSAGEVRLDGKRVESPGADRGMVFQGYTLFPWLTVRGNVMFGPRLRGVNAKDAEKLAETWLEIVGLTRFADHYPEQLSGGMKQRVAIARALANEPRVLLMDEPFGALDAQTRCGMQTHLLRVWDSVDLTVLFITHDLEEAVYLSDRIVVLSANPGRVAEVIEVPLPRPRHRSQLMSGAFLSTKMRLEALIYQSESVQE
jgi:NitT/TauT family transport system ATP-binding protein